MREILQSTLENEKYVWFTLMGFCTAELKPIDFIFIKYQSSVYQRYIYGRPLDPQSMLETIVHVAEVPDLNTQSSRREIFELPAPAPFGRATSWI